MSVEYRELVARYEQELELIDLNQSKFYVYSKRLFDIVGALIGLLISFPIIFITLIAIKLESKGPGFYKQERLGYNSKKFFIYKLRSMYVDAEKNGAQWAQKSDPRVTKVGAFIRKTRIDELPQFVNILLGDMSFIGPRPERPFFTERFDKEIPGFKLRLQVKPGLTGWAQVNGGYDISPAQKFNLDMEYIKKRSIKLECIILLKTVKIVFTGEGAR